MTDSGSSVRRPGGRTERTRQAVHRACLELLGSHGALGFGIEELSRASGVHRTTLYRRWASVPPLLGEVAEELIGRDVPVPDTGSFTGDLTALASAIADVINDPVSGPALTALFTAPRSLTEVDDAVRRFWQRRLETLTPVVARAVEREELPADVDPELVFETLGAPLYYRYLLTRRPVDEAAVRRAVAGTLAAADAGVLGPRP